MGHIIPKVPAKQNIGMNGRQMKAAGELSGSSERERARDLDTDRERESDREKQTDRQRMN